MSQTTAKTKKTHDQEAKESGRQRMGGVSQKLKVEGIPKGYKARWFNHTGDRLLMAQRAGYQPVLSGGDLGDVNYEGSDKSDLGQWRSKKVGVQDGQPLFAYLMAIKTEWYEEDKARKMADIDSAEQALRETPINQQDKSGLTTVKQADIQTNVPLR